MRTTIAALVCACAAIACASASPTPYDSPIPGTIGVAVARNAAGVVVIAVRAGGAAAAAGVQAGDRVMRLNGDPVSDPRQFEQRVLDSSPGRVLRLELARDGKTRVVEVPVEEISTASIG